MNAWSSLSAAAAEFAAAAKAQGASFAEAVQLLAAAYDRHSTSGAARDRGIVFRRSFRLALDSCLKP